MLESDLVLLSKADTKYDCDGNEIQLFEGKIVDIYTDDKDDQGYADNLIASGTVGLTLMEYKMKVRKLKNLYIQIMWIL